MKQIIPISYLPGVFAGDKYTFDKINQMLNAYFELINKLTQLLKTVSKKGENKKNIAPLASQVVSMRETINKEFCSLDERHIIIDVVLHSIEREYNRTLDDMLNRII